MLTIAAEREPEAIMNAMVRGIAQCPDVVLSPRVDHRAGRHLCGMPDAPGMS